MELKEVILYDVFVDGIKVFPNPVARDVADKVFQYYQNKEAIERKNEQV